MRTGLQASTRCSCQILMKLEIFWQIFEKYSNSKFHENPSSGSRVVPCRQRDTTKVIVVFRSFAKAPKKKETLVYYITHYYQ